MGGGTVTGPRWIRESCGFDTIPLLVRPGAVLPVGARDDRPDYPYEDGVTLHLYQLTDGAHVTATVPTTRGESAATFTVIRDGAAVRVDRSGTSPPAPWRVLLVGERSVASVDGGSLAPSPTGTLVELPATTERCTVTLAAAASPA